MRQKVVAGYKLWNFYAAKLYYACCKMPRIWMSQFQVWVTSQSQAVSQRSIDRDYRSTSQQENSGAVGASSAADEKCSQVFAPRGGVSMNCAKRKGPRFWGSTRSCINFLKFLVTWITCSIARCVVNCGNPFIHTTEHCTKAFSKLATSLALRVHSNYIIGTFSWWKTT